MKPIFATLAMLFALNAFANDQTLTRQERQKLRAAAHDVVGQDGGEAILSPDLGPVEVLAINRPEVLAKFTWQEIFFEPRTCVFTYNLVKHRIVKDTVRCQSSHK